MSIKPPRRTVRVVQLPAPAATAPALTATSQPVYVLPAPCTVAASGSSQLPQTLTAARPYIPQIDSPAQHLVATTLPLCLLPPGRRRVWSSILHGTRRCRTKRSESDCRFGLSRA